MLSTISRTAKRVQTRQFHASLRASDRAFIYKEYGNPLDVLQAITYPTPTEPPAKGTLNAKFILSSLNPADINTVEGVYPSRPSISNIGRENNVFIAGNEGLAEVISVGHGVQGVKAGDWVVMDKPQRGTWCTSRNFKAEDVIPVQRVPGLTAASAANLMVNLCTARNLLDSSAPGHLTTKGTVVLQNGANSGVGQAVIQMARADNVHTINFVRNRDDYASLEKHLMDLGATHVFTYDDLADKTKRKEIMKLASDLSDDGKGAHLALNCVGGDAATFMTQLLKAPDPLFVTYGAMAKKPFSFPAGAQIFNNLRLEGFWQSRISGRQTREERTAVHSRILQYIQNDQLREPAHEVIAVPASLSDADATELMKDTLGKIAAGKYGKKIMLRVD